jgi:uncharacterized protein YerC
MDRAHNFIDMAGRRIGRLRVISRAPETDERGQAKWNCRCECGVETIVRGLKLRQGHTKSCGCLRRLSGSANPNADNRPVLDRLAERSYVILATGCKIWTGTHQHFGHGYITVGGARKLVHRVAWEEERGKIPEGLDCLHNCPGGDNPACWNVDHLWLGTQGDNNADRDRKGRHVPLPGMLHGCARLTDEQIAAIRADKRSYREIADHHGVAESHIGVIVRGDGWKHLPGASHRKRGPVGGGPRVRLTESAVRTIRSDARSHDALAKEFGVSSSLIGQVKRRVIWRHIA